MKTVEQRRRYQRDYARRRNAAKLAEKQRNSKTCLHRLGRYVCGGELETTVGEFGATVVRCVRCERRKMGICAHCLSRVCGTVGRSRYCRDHRKAVSRISARKSGLKNKAEKLAKARSYYQDNPEVRARRNEYKRLYRKANPEKVRAQKRREVARQRKSYLEYHRRYNAQLKRQQEKRRMAKDAYYRDNPVRPSPKCVKCTAEIPWMPLPGGRQGRPPKTCDACCSKYDLARRQAVRARQAEAQAAPVKKRRRVKPLRVQHPMPSRYAPTGERLCFTPGCDIVVTHRKKKCSKCRDLEAREARALIDRLHGGRGRRTDLESKRIAA